MLIIKDTLVSLDIVENQFHCHLASCKGACCTEGDYGAPITQGEMALVEEWKEIILSALEPGSVKKIEEAGAFTFYAEPGKWGTSCLENGACVFLVKETSGISFCSIESLYNQGQIPFNKPISCHLYPIRITQNEISGFEAWNYDEWDICSPACSFGKTQNMPLYVFVKEAIIRAKGEAFYAELEAAATHLSAMNGEETT